jgi:hypothetical protein
VKAAPPVSVTEPPHVAVPAPRHGTKSVRKERNLSVPHIVKEDVEPSKSSRRAEEAVIVQPEVRDAAVNVSLDSRKDSRIIVPRRESLRLIDSRNSSGRDVLNDSARQIASAVRERLRNVNLPEPKKQRNQNEARAMNCQENETKLRSAVLGRGSHRVGLLRDLKKDGDSLLDGYDDNMAFTRWRFRACVVSDLEEKERVKSIKIREDMSVMMGLDRQLCRYLEQEDVRDFVKTRKAAPVVHLPAGNRGDATCL